MPVWVRGEKRRGSPPPSRSRLQSRRWATAASTPAQGIEGELVGFSTLDELKAAPDSAFAERSCSSTTRCRGPRTARATALSAARAAKVRRSPAGRAPSPSSCAPSARIITEIRTRASCASTRVLQPIPAGALSVPDAEQVQRILKRGQPVTIEAGSDPAEHRHSPVGQCDCRSPWPRPEGAADPGQRPSRQLGPWDGRDRRRFGRRNRRGLRKANHGRWTPFEDDPRGLVRRGGSRAVRRARLSRSMARSRITRSRRATSAPIASGRSTASLERTAKRKPRRLQSALAPLGIVPGSLDEADGSDIGPMLADGLPGVTLRQDGTHYFDLHHTADDTLDKVDPEALRQNVAAWTTMLAVLSGGIEPEPKRRKQR